MPTNRKKAPVVLGAQKAGQQFRCEVARELGILIPNDEHKSNRVLKTPAIQGAMSKRMIELAEQQIHQK
ncbi:MAG: small, acid-soluble spore protein, alpha/beta type [Tumebacillaceae bacterium]